MVTDEAPGQSFRSDQRSAVVAERPPLPGSLLAAAVIILVLGVFSALGASLIFLMAWLSSQFPAEFQVPATGEAVAAFLGLAAAFGVALMVAAVAHIVVGIGVIRRRSWARVAGMVVAIVGIVLTLTGLAFTFIPGAQIDPFTGQPYPPMDPATLVIGAFFTCAPLIAYVWVVVVLVRRGDAFPPI